MATRRPRRAVTPAPAVTQIDPLQAIRNKFSRLTELQTQIEAAKHLYAERDALVEELIPCFIGRTDNGWSVKAQITLGDKTYRLHPSFFNAEKNKIVAKTWKSAAFPTLTIEG
jgi:hypothetical protein